MALFEMKTFSLLEMRMKTGLLRRMTGKLRRPHTHHRHLRAQGHLNPTSKSSGLMRNPTSQMNLLTTIKAALGDITFDQMIH
jgi:hypothetical protein